GGRSDDPTPRRATIGCLACPPCCAKRSKQSAFTEGTCEPRRSKTRRPVRPTRAMRRMNHPSPEGLVAHFIDADSAIAVHVATCPECLEQLTWIREATGELRAAAPSRWAETPQCLSEAAVAAFVDGQSAGAAREAIVAHLADCARCRAVGAAVARL